MHALGTILVVPHEHGVTTHILSTDSLTARLYPKGSLLHDGSTLIQPGHSPIDILWDAARLIGTVCSPISALIN
jgi:hypothetical protein